MRWLALVSVAACNHGYEDTSVPPTTTLVETGTNGTFPSTSQTDAVTDSFTQIPLSPVDLLVVVDNSSGMGSRQSALADAYDDLVKPYFDAGVDVQIGFVSTDVTDAQERGRLHQLPDQSLWISTQTADPEGAFRTAVQMGESGDRHTEGIGATLLALDPSANPGNAGFVREPARLEILVFSMHDDANDSLVLADTAAALHAYKTEPARVRFSAVVNFPGCACADGGLPGAKYAILQGVMLGDLFDLEDAAWATAVSSIPARNDVLDHSFTLSGTPDPATIAITVNGAAPDPTSWQYKAGADSLSNTIVFNLGQEPPYSSTIDVTWEPPGT